MTTGTVSIDNSLLSGTAAADKTTSAGNAAVNSTVAAENTASAAEPGFSETLKTASSRGFCDLDAIFEAASQTYGVSVDLLKAVARAESNFRPDATSKCGAMGIMQLMPGTAKMLGVTDAYDPEQNIMGGAKFLRQMLDKFGGDVRLALAAYNAGPGNVVKYGGIPPFNETQNYVKTVTGYLGEGAISAGSVYRNGLSSGRYLSNKQAAPSGASLLSGSMSQMLLMRIIEMQMNSSDDKKENKVF